MRYSNLKGDNETVATDTVSYIKKIIIFKPINEFSKVTGYNNSIQNLLYFCTFTVNKNKLRKFIYNSINKDKMLGNKTVENEYF